jgi:hypothetical protein
MCCTVVIVMADGMLVSTPCRRGVVVVWVLVNPTVSWVSPAHCKVVDAHANTSDSNSGTN